MYPSLNFGLASIGEKDLEKKLQLAQRHGFSHVELGASEILDAGVERAKTLLTQYGISVSGANLPFHPIQLSDTDFEAAMEALPEQAAALSAVGCTRCIIWIFPASDTLTLEENYAQHVRRLSPAAAVLKAHGMRLGLEFIGPNSGRANKKYTFLYTAEEMLKLARDCGDNVGLLFDAWHWHMGAGNTDVFEHIGDACHIVSVHVNDAPEGDRLTLPDSPRALPGETGIINIGYVIDGLRKLGYDGPLVVESFSPKLNDLPDDDARAACMKACFDKILG